MSTLSVENLKHPSSSNANITLDSNGNINLGAGSASLPSITAQGDTNTGIYFPAADNIGFATGGTIRGRWTDNGLCFGTDTAAANALDDYEQGTWTPTYIAGTTNPTITYQAQNGSYVKIGEMVYFNLELETSVATGGSGDLYVGGLPFTTANLRFPGGGVVTYADAFTTNAPDTTAAQINTTFLRLFFHQSATGSGVINTANLTNGASKNFIICTGAYRSA